MLCVATSIRLSLLFLSRLFLDLLIDPASIRPFLLFLGIPYLATNLCNYAILPRH